MTAEIVAALGLVLVIAGVVVANAVLAYRSGKDVTSKKESKDAKKKLERHNDPLATNVEYYGRLRRAQERLARLRNREAKR